MNTFHASWVEGMDLLVQLLWGDPVSKLALDTLSRLRNSFDLLLRADDCLGLDAGNILGVSPGQEAVVVLGQRN